MKLKVVAEDNDDYNNTVLVNVAALRIEISIDDPSMTAEKLSQLIRDVLTHTAEVNVHRIDIQEFWDKVMQKYEVAES